MAWYNQDAQTLTSSYPVEHCQFAPGFLDFTIKGKGTLVILVHGKKSPLRASKITVRPLPHSATGVHEDGLPGSQCRSTNGDIQVSRPH